MGVLPRGPKGCALNSSYQTRETREYKEDLGYALVNIARLVPDGLLVFFPSYSVLTSCIEFWKQGIPGQSGWLLHTLWSFAQKMSVVCHPERSSAMKLLDWLM